MQPKTVAKRIRKNLVSQKDRLEEYLNVLEKENEDLFMEDPDRLIEHINLEKNIIKELISFKKILDPLEVMYFKSPYKKDDSILDMKNYIDNLSSQIREKTSHNKEKLNTILVKVESDLKDLSKKNKSKSVYENIDSRLVDVSG